MSDSYGGVVLISNDFGSHEGSRYKNVLVNHVAAALVAAIHTR